MLRSFCDKSAISRYEARGLDYEDFYLICKLLNKTVGCGWI